MANTRAEAAEEFKNRPDRYWFPRTLLRFFVRLPDPLPLPDRSLYIQTSPVTPWQSNDLARSGLAVRIEGGAWISNLSSQSVWQPIATNNDDDELPVVKPDGPDEPKGTQQFLNVVRLWNGEIFDDRYFNDARATAETQLRRKEVAARALSPERDAPPSPPFETVLDYTVAEVVVPLFDQTANDEHEAWDKSLDYAIQCVRHLVRSLNTVRPQSYRLPTREGLPFAVFYEVGVVSPDLQGDHDFPVLEWVEEVANANESARFSVRPPPLNSFEAKQLSLAIHNQLTAAPLYLYQELRRRAKEAVDREGNYDASVIWSATAAEYLLDEVLRLMLWESNARPELSCGPFKVNSVVKRVEANFSALTGPHWSTQAPGPFRDWRDKVTTVRNSIIHDGLEATAAQAREAVVTVDLLLTEVGDLLVKHFDRCWRTAFLLLGHRGLEKRDMLKTFEIKAASVLEAPWAETFTNWRGVNLRKLRDNDSPRAPDISRSHLIFVFGRRNRGFWILSDNESMLAIHADVNEDSLNEMHRTQIVEMLDGPQEENDEGAISIAFEGPTILRTHNPWQECYTLLPMQSAKRAGRSIRDSEFKWRPSFAPRPAAS